MFFKYTANAKIVAETRLDLATLVPLAHQLRHPAIASVLYPANNLTYDHCTAIVQDGRSPVVHWRADDECGDWPTNSKQTSRTVLGAASAGWPCGDDRRYSPTNLGFSLRRSEVDEGAARKIPESSSRHCEIAVQPPVRRGTDLDLGSFQPAYKRIRC